jgi:hypothetical protein
MLSTSAYFPNRKDWMSVIWGKLRLWRALGRLFHGNTKQSDVILTARYKLLGRIPVKTVVEVAGATPWEFWLLSGAIRGFWCINSSPNWSLISFVFSFLAHDW